MDRGDFLNLGGGAIAAGAMARTRDRSAAAQGAAPLAAPADFPDFTRGRWKTTAPLPIVHM